MKRILTITALIASGLAAYAQTLILSDSFDTGGTDTTDLNFNQGARQAGSAAPVNFAATTDGPTLTAAGMLNMTTTNGWASVDADPLTTEIGSGSFSIKWKVQHDGAAANWSMFTVLSDVNSNWDLSPMTVNLWHHDFIHMDYGASNNVAGTNLRVDMSPDAVNAAIGGVYDANALNEFEIRAFADNATSGTWGLFLNGAALASGLPYTFEDAAKKLRWNATARTDADWNDLEVTTLSDSDKPDYVFFDNFNGSDSAPGDLNAANWGYGARQTNGQVVAIWADNPNLFTITNNVLHHVGGFLRSEFDYASHLDGNDFEFSFKAAVYELGTEWTSVYLYDETGVDRRDDSRLGIFLTGLGDPGTVGVIYSGTGAAATSQGVGVAEVELAIGGTYSKTNEHTFTFVSIAGTGGTNSYSLLIDGFAIPSATGLPYYFDGAERRIGISSILNDNGADYDDISLKAFIAPTYEEWTSEQGLVGADTNRTADIENGGLGDGMDNLLEYALGGDPNFDDAAAIMPAVTEIVGDNMIYIYRRRVDYAVRGLSYDVNFTFDLVLDPLTNSINNVTGIAPIDSSFESVTNPIPTIYSDDAYFRLDVTEN
jgi:hypothetical protein